MKTARASFRKSDRLCGVRAVSELFMRGKTFIVPPVKVIYLVLPENDRIKPVRVLFSVPKKHFRRAVDRNLIRRRLREAWRLNLLPLTETLSGSGRRLELAIIWNTPDIKSYQITEKCVREIIERLTHLKY